MTSSSRFRVILASLMLVALTTGCAVDKWSVDAVRPLPMGSVGGVLNLPIRAACVGCATVLQDKDEEITRTLFSAELVSGANVASLDTTMWEETGSALVQLSSLAIRCTSAGSFQVRLTAESHLRRVGATQELPYRRFKGASSPISLFCVVGGDGGMDGGMDGGVDGMADAAPDGGVDQSADGMPDQLSDPSLDGSNDQLLDLPDDSQADGSCAYSGCLSCASSPYDGSNSTFICAQAGCAVVGITCGTPLYTLSRNGGSYSVLAASAGAIASSSHGTVNGTNTEVTGIPPNQVVTITLTSGGPLILDFSPSGVEVLSFDP